MLTHKECTTCSQYLPLTSFPAHKSAVGGRSSECRSCATARTRQWKAANYDPRVTSAYNRDYYLRNREKLKARAVERRAERKAKEMEELDRRRREALGLPT